ncbi:amidase [Mesorhizobium sp. M0924]|uniref:amidase n=1 Tax=unclassified Mesorhizobium TaxID=325217 RepID=UPI003337AB6D
MSLSPDIALLSLAELSRRLRAREISPLELTKTYLDRIAALDQRLHSFNSLRTESALQEASAAEQALMRGDWLGPLHGVPIGIKDLIDVAGLPTTAQAVHRRDEIASEDAGVVASLKRAGAIILGKQATTEYAVSGTQFDLGWPPARNPWNLDLDPSSSSSGSAIAVAAGLCAGSVGTETAGSIRDPAAWCGVAGLKPTDALVSRKGVLPLSRSMDCVGPLAWTVEDCALMIASMVSTDTDDLLLRGFKSPDISGIGEGIRGLRVGVIRQFYEGDPDVDQDVLDAMENTLAVVQDLGGRVSSVKLADFGLYGSVARNITWPEEYAEHRAELDAYPERFHPVSRSRLQDGKTVSAADYIDARLRQKALTEALAGIMEDVDVLVLPTMKTPAQILGYEMTEMGEMELSLSRPFNLTGSPALAICNGFTATGLPISMQIVGRKFEDDTVLRAGHSVEQALGLRSRRPVVATENPG